MNKIEMLLAQLNNIDNTIDRTSLKNRELLVLKKEYINIEKLLGILDKLNIKITLIDIVDIQNLQNILKGNRLFLFDKLDEAFLANLPKGMLSKVLNFDKFFDKLNSDLSNIDIEDFDFDDILSLISNKKVGKKTVTNIVNSAIEKFSFAKLSKLSRELSNREDLKEIKNLLVGRLESMNRKQEISSKEFLLFSNQKIDIKSFNQILKLFDSKISFFQGEEVKPNSHFLLNDSLNQEDVNNIHLLTKKSSSIMYNFSSFLHNLKSVLSFENISPFYNKNLISKIEILKNPILPDNTFLELIAKTDFKKIDRDFSKIIFNIFTSRFSKNLIGKDLDSITFNFDNQSNLLKSATNNLNSLGFEKIVLDKLDIKESINEMVQKSITTILNENSMTEFKTQILEQLANSNSKMEFNLFSNILLALSNKIFTFLDFNGGNYNYFQFKESKESKDSNRDSNFAKIEFFSEFKNLESVAGVLFTNDKDVELTLKSNNRETLEFLKSNLDELKRVNKIYFEVSEVKPLFKIDTLGVFDVKG